MSRNQIGVMVEDAALAQRVAECLRFVGEEAVVLDASAPLPPDVRRLIGTPAALHRLNDATSLGRPCSLPAIQLGGARNEAWLQTVAFVDLPLRLDGLLAALQTSSGSVAEAPWAQDDHDAARLFPELIGRSEAMRRLRKAAAHVLEAQGPILLLGEPGSGQLGIAQGLHCASRRAEGAFVPLDCASVVPEALDSELYGHEKGAFAGALSRKVGRFELARGGTLYLDSIDVLSPTHQSKLIRAIESRAIERAGGLESIHVDVRIVATAYTDLGSAVGRGVFRQDLYRAFAAHTVDVPTLRARKEDIPAEIARINANTGQRHGMAMRFHPDTLSAFAAYEWPRNLSELEQVLDRLAASHPKEMISVPQLPVRMRPAVNEGAVRDGTGPKVHGDRGAGTPGLLDPERLPLLPVNGIDLRDYLTRLERSLIQQALIDTHHVVARAADRLHIRRTTLVEKMRKYGLTRLDPHFAAEDSVAGGSSA